MEEQQQIDLSTEEKTDIDQAMDDADRFHDEYNDAELTK